MSKTDRLTDDLP